MFADGNAEKSYKKKTIHRGILKRRQAKKRNYFLRQVLLKQEIEVV